MESIKRELHQARVQTRLYRTLAAANHAAMRAETMEEVYDGLCRAAVEDGGFLFSWVGVPDGSGRIQPLHMAGPQRSRDYLTAAFVSEDPNVPEGRGPSGLAWREKRAVVVDDVQTDAKAAPWRDAFARGGIRSALAIPICPSGMRVALFVIYSDEPGFFTPEIVELGRNIVREAEYALGNLVMAEQVSAMDAALHESRRLFSRMISTLPTACYIFNSLERRMVYAGPGIERVSGLSPDQTIQKGAEVHQAMHPDDYAVNDPAARHQKLLDGEIWEWQARFRRPGGEWRWHRLRETVFERDADGRVRQVLGSIEDVHDLIVLAAEKRRIASAVDAAAESVVITDPSGIIVYVNPAFTRVTGYSREEAVGRKVSLLKSGRHPEEFYRALWQTLASGRVWQGRLVNRRKDGSLFEEEASISPVHDQQGRIANYVAVKRDVTKELELEQQLLQAQKLEAIGRLAGGVAHDFNNILTAILGSAELLAMQLPTDSPLRDDVEEVRRSGLRAADLTRQLLIFSRRQAASPRVVDPARILADLEKMLGRIVGENYRLTANAKISDARINVDPGQFEQVVMNFVVNARDATPPGGTIEIGLRSEVLREPLSGVSGEVPPGSYVVLAVKDTGAGIAPEVLPHIFEPFFTTKPSGVGTGLGLSTVYGIAKQAGAHLRVDTAVGRGTTISIYWREVGGDERLAAAAPTTSQQGTERILVVEDEPAVRRLVERQLSSAGYQVRTAGDAREALPLAETDSFDLLLTDVILSDGTDGWNLSADVRRARPGIKVLFMSGYTGDSPSEAALPHRDERLLQKPFTHDGLLEAVRGALDARP